MHSPDPPTRRQSAVLDTLLTRHAVGEIADRGSKIDGIVPLHDRSEIAVDQQRRTFGAPRHDQRGLDLSSRKRARIDIADPQPTPLPRLPSNPESAKPL